MRSLRALSGFLFEMPVLVFLFVLFLLLIFLTPAPACNGVPAAAVYHQRSYTQCAATSYVAPATVYSQATILAYPLTLVAAPAVTVVAQPVVVPPATVVPPAATQPAPVQQQVPVQQQEVQQSYVPQPSLAVVQRQVYADYAVPLAAVVSHSYAYGATAAYGVARTAVIIERNVVRHRAAAPRRFAPVRNLFANIRANRTARGVAVR